MEQEWEQAEEQSNIIEYKNAIFALTNKVKMLEEKNESLENMQEDFKQHYEKIKKENGDLRSKFYELSSQKKQVEAEASSQMQHLKMMLETREQTLSSQRSRLVESPDIELIKANLCKKLEVPYRIREQAMKLENEKLEQQANELKRTNNFLKAEIEDMRKDHKRELEQFRHRSLEQSQDLQLEIQLLQAKESNSQEKELLRSLRRDCEDYKRHNLDLQKEINELKQENEKIKEREKGLALEIESIEDNAKIESEHQQEEIEKIKQLLQNSENERAVLEQKFNEKNKEVRELKNNNEELALKGKELELQLSRANARCVAVENSLREREAEIEVFFIQLQEEEKEKQITNRNEKEELQSEILRLKQALENAEEVDQEEMDVIKGKLSHVEKDRRIWKEEFLLLRRKHKELSNSYDHLKNNYMRRNQQKIKAENELRILKKKFNSLSSQNQDLLTAKQHLEYSSQTLEEEFARLSAEKKLWKKERFDLQNQISTLTNKIETFLNDSAAKISRAKTKAAEFKSQCLQANLKVRQLSAQLSKREGDSPHALEESFGVHPSQPRNIGPSVSRELYNQTPDAELLEQEIAQTLQQK